MVDEKDGDDKDAKLVKLVNQYMAPPTPEFKVVSVDDHHGCNDWADSRKHLNLLVNELEVRKTFKDKSECVNVIKRWYIKKYLQ